MRSAALNALATHGLFRGRFRFSGTFRIAFSAFHGFFHGVDGFFHGFLSLFNGFFSRLDRVFNSFFNSLFSRLNCLGSFFNYGRGLFHHGFDGSFFFFLAASDSKSGGSEDRENELVHVNSPFQLEAFIPSRDKGCQARSLLQIPYKKQAKPSAAEGKVKNAESLLYRARLLFILRASLENHRRNATIARRPHNAPPQRDTGPRVNDRIRSPEIRLIGAEGENIGVVTPARALALAEEAGLDLVEISPNAEPPVCKIMDYGKFKYEQQKRESEARKKQKIIEIKEIKFRPGTDTHDYEVKMRSVVKFLEGGDKVKVTLRFRGREMAHQQLGMELLNRVAADVAELGKVENMPKLEGRQMVMMIGPK